MRPAEGPGGPASWRHSGIFGCQQLLRDSWPAHTRMHANRLPRCMACMHGESWIEYSVSRIFHDFSVRGSTRINCIPVLLQVPALLILTVSGFTYASLQHSLASGFGRLRAWGSAGHFARPGARALVIHVVLSNFATWLHTLRNQKISTVQFLFVF